MSIVTAHHDHCMVIRMVAVKVIVRVFKVPPQLQLVNYSNMVVP